MLEKLNIDRLSAEVDLRESERVKPRVIQALDSLRQDGIDMASHSQIVRKIQQIHRPKHIFDRIRNSVMSLSLEMLEEDGEIETETVVVPTFRRKLKSLPIVLYRRLTPEQKTSE